MAARAKYLFDHDFTAGSAAEKAIAPSEHAILIGEAESKGFRDGFAAAEKEGTAVARKLAPELVSRQPFAEIAALATGCFRQLASAPHVVVRVNDALHQTARIELDEIARTRGFEGRLVVLAEPE